MYSLCEARNLIDRGVKCTPPDPSSFRTCHSWSTRIASWHAIDLVYAEAKTDRLCLHNDTVVHLAWNLLPTHRLSSGRQRLLSKGNDSHRKFRHGLCSNAWSIYPNSATTARQAGPCEWLCEGTIFGCGCAEEGKERVVSAYNGDLDTNAKHLTLGECKRRLTTKNLSRDHHRGWDYARVMRHS